MKHVNKERIKSIVIISLFVISLIQVGILWSKQSHRFPINFLAGIFGRPQIQVSDEMTRDELFIPYRLVLSNGEYSHWILDRKNPVYQPLWKEVKSYLADIAKGSYTAVTSQSNWGEITSKKGFEFEFKVGIKPDLLKWFLGNPNSSVEIPAVYKIMIIPDSSNERINSMYIYDTNEKVHKYLPREYIRAKSFAETLSKFANGSMDTYRKYVTMYESNFLSKLNVVPDALYVVTAPSYWPYNTISSVAPGSLGNKDEVAKALLGEIQKERYSQREYDDGTIQFNIKENLYKIYPGGILEFKNFSEADSGTGESVGAALLNAYSFIKKAESLTGSKADIYLSGLVQENGVYSFSFDYMVNGHPVYVDLTLAGPAEKVFNAVTIKANSKRVLYCRYIIRDFDIENKSNYKDRFLDIMAGGDISYKQVQIKNMGVGYVINSIEDMQLAPYMVLENKETSELITKKLPEQKGD